MARYKLHSAEKVKKLPPSGQRGELQVWKVELESVDGDKIEAEQLTKPDNSPGDIGGFVDGTITNSEYGPKFRKDAAPREGRGGRSPQETAAIQTQHSQEMALRLLAIKYPPGQLPENWRDQVMAVTDYFDDQITRGVERKNGNGS